MCSSRPPSNQGSGQFRKKISSTLHFPSKFLSFSRENYRTHWSNCASPSLLWLTRIELQMASAVDASGNPIPSSSVLMASSKHIGIRCHSENLEFLKCKKKDPNPEKCLDKGRDVTRCVLGLWVFLLCADFFYPCLVG